VRIDPRAWLRLPIPTLLLAGVSVAIGVASLIVVAGGTRADQLLATPAKGPAPLTIDLSPAPRTGDLGAIKAQPLLHASRTFYVAPLPAVAPTSPPRPDYRLAGTILVPRKPAVAMLTSRAGGATLRVKPGDTLEGWTVQAVERRLVTLTWQNERFDITAAQVPVSAGLTRVPIMRQRVAVAGVQTLSASGTSAPAAVGGPLMLEQPRLYRPPPQ
jgi:hypothetical protein